MTSRKTLAQRLGRVLQMIAGQSGRLPETSYDGVMGQPSMTGLGSASIRRMMRYSPAPGGFCRTSRMKFDEVRCGRRSPAGLPERVGLGVSRRLLNRECP